MDEGLRADVWVPLTDGAVDLVRQRVVRGGEETRLSSREAELLAYLWRRQGEVIPREQLLAEVWSYRSSRPTRAVDLAVSRLRKKIEVDAAEPRHLLSVFGEGYRFVPPERSAGAGAIAGRRAEVRTNLVAAGTPLRGRDAELDRLHALLEGEARLVTLVGPGGVGKTRLAREAGLREVDRRAGGAWFCDLAGVTALGDLVEVVAAAVGVPLAGHGDAESAMEQVTWALATRPALLLLMDNLEQARVPAAKALDTWLGRLPDLAVLATSRERLRVEGEYLLEVHPLEEDAALCLFVDRYEALHGRAPGDQAVRAVVRQLDGLPLALELAASRTRTLSLERLAERLDNRLALLRDTGGGQPSRHATLSAVLDASWELMDPHEQRLLAWLSAFRGGFDVDAVEGACSEDDPAAPWPLDVLEGLRERSLVTLDSDGERYGLLETVREYAARQLADRGEEAVAWARHAAWFADLGFRLVEETRGPAVVERLQDLERERGNLLAAVRRARDPEQIARLALVVDRLVQSRGPGGLNLEVLDLAVRRTKALRGALRCRVLVQRGRSHLVRHDVEAAIADAESALGEAAEAGSDLGRAIALELRAYVHDWRQRPEAAIADLEEAYRLECTAEGPDEAALTLLELAESYAEAGRFDESEATLARALAAFDRRGARWPAAVGRVKASTLAALCGRIDEAYADAERGQQALSELGDERNAVLTLIHYLASFAEMGGDLERGAQILRDARARANRAGMRKLALDGLILELTARIGLAQVDTAEALLREAQPLGRAAAGLFGRGPVVGPTLQLFAGMVALERGRVAEALAAAREGYAGCRMAGSAVARAEGAIRFGWIQLEAGPAEGAGEHFDEAAEAAGEAGLDVLRAVALGGGALAAARQGDAGGTSRRCAAAREATSHPLSTWIADRWEPVAQALLRGERPALDDASWPAGPIPWLRVAPAVGELVLWRRVLNRLGGG